MKRNFHGKTVAITGAAGGLGKALCHHFGAAGSKILALDVNGAALNDLEQELQQKNIEVFTQVCDITDAVSCQDAFAKGTQKLGPVFCLINNAGITHLSEFVETPVEVVQKVIEINLFGAIFCTKACLNDIIENQGVIVAISSVAGYSPLFARTGYAASKHGMHGFFHTLRTELKHKNVSVMMVCPAFIDTGIRQAATQEADKHIRKPGGPQKTVGQIMSPQQVAQKIYRGACKGARLLLLGRISLLSYWINKLRPSLFEKLMLRNVRQT